METIKLYEDPIKDEIREDSPDMHTPPKPKTSKKCSISIENQKKR
jgi:hypothetical protein